MNDRTITRAVRQGARTTPITHTTRRKPRKTKAPALSPEQIAAAVVDARNARIAADLADYARSHPMNDHNDAHSLAQAAAVSCA